MAFDRIGLEYRKKKRNRLATHRDKGRQRDAAGMRGGGLEIPGSQSDSIPRDLSMSSGRFLR